MTTDRKTTEELKALLDRALDQTLSDPEQMKTLAAHYRNTLSDSYRYSLMNTLLIMFQGGSVCNSYKRWQAMGRQVRKGEKARIQIIRPATVKTEDKETGEIVHIRTSKFYPCKVFDLAQTDGPEVYQHNTPDTADSGPLWATVCRAIENAGLPVKEVSLADARGYTTGKEVAVSMFSTNADKTKTALHELAHVWLGHTGQADKTPETRAAHEVEAEAAAMLAAAALGVPAETSPAYIAEYNKHAANVRKMEILTTAQKIIRTITEAAA